MADSGQNPACPWLGLVGKGRRASGGPIGTGAGDRFAGWRLLGRLEGEEVAGLCNRERGERNDGGEEREGIKILTFDQITVLPFAVFCS